MDADKRLNEIVSQTDADEMAGVRQKPKPRRIAMAEERRYQTPRQSRYANKQNASDEMAAEAPRYRKQENRTAEAEPRRKSAKPGSDRVGQYSTMMRWTQMARDMSS